MNKKILDVINKNSIYAIIPARSGSKGVKNKNIKLLNGYPMIAYSIVAAKLTSGIDRVIVSTDSAEYARFANKFGGETPFLRPAEISQDNSTDIEFMQHCINWLYENERKVPEYFLHLRPTNPLRKIQDIETAINKIKNDVNATSLRSAHLASNTPYKWFEIKNTGYFGSILGERTNDEANNPRQKFNDVYIPDGYVDVLKSEFIIKNNLMHGQNMIPYIVNDCIDIDAKKDIELLEFYIKKHNSEILDYLNKHYEKENLS